MAVPAAGWLRWAESHGLAHLAHGIFRAEELGAHPAEDVIHDGFRIGDVRIPRRPAGLETHVGELIHQELEGHTVLQVEAHGGGEGVHQAGNGGASLAMVMKISPGAPSSYMPTVM